MIKFDNLRTLSVTECKSCGLKVILNNLISSGGEWECEYCLNHPELREHDKVLNKIKPLMVKSLCNKKGFGSHLWFSEVHAGNRRNRESPDIIGFRNDNITTMIEVKATRADFLSDKHKEFRKNQELGMGSHRYYACPEGLISKDELPEKWGLIELVNDKPMVKVWASEIVHRNHAAEQNLLFSLMRRINNYVPVQDLVMYDKMVNREVSFHTSSKPKSKYLLNNIKKVRSEMWDKLVKKISHIRN